MSELTRDGLERIREALRAERWAVARLHALASASAREVLARADAEEWHSPAADLFRARLTEISEELTSARRAFARAIDAIDRALLALANVVPVEEPVGAAR
jgi:hypothetical protein